MNSERLVSMIRQVHLEMTQLEIRTKMERLQNHLQSAINSPQESTQRAVEDQLNELLESLEKADSNNFSPGWKANLKTLVPNGNTPSDQLLGLGLASLLREAFDDSGYTSVQTLDAIIQLTSDISTLETHAANLVEAFNALQMEDESLEPGTSVVGMYIPRDEVPGGLSELNNELRFFNIFLSTLTQIVEGEAETIPVYSVSSSEFLGLDAITTLNVAASVTTIMTGISLVLKKMLRQKKFKEEAEELRFSKEILDQIDAQSNAQVEEQLDGIHIEICQSSKIENEHRKTEMNSALRLHLNSLAMKHERGFHIDVRTQEENDVTEEDAEKVKSIRTYATIEFLPPQGARVLELPEADLDDPDADKSE